jgi:hypothetical protein
LLFFCQESFFKVPPFYVLNLISAAIGKMLAVLSAKHLVQRKKEKKKKKKKTPDPFGLAVGLALIGTVSEGGHSSLQSTDSAVGSDHKNVSLKKKKRERKRGN